MTTHADAHDLLKQHFGWPKFKQGQLDVIQRLLGKQSVLAVFPTGGGKSLCYQLPALALDGLTVVVSPLIALMKDQIDQLQARGILAVRLDSSLTSDEYRDAMQAVRDGRAKLLYVAPERFFNERFRSSLDKIKISLFAVDEAHCISQWGHNFRPDYLKLASIARTLNVERVLALTATATPSVQTDICEAFEIQADDVICTEFFRPNLHIRSNIVDDHSRTDALIEKLQAEPQGPSIIYVTRQKTAEQVAESLTNKQFKAQAYHAGMDTEKRNAVQEWFMNGDQNIVVATIAFGMGIDKSGIRAVYHFNPPKSIENYAQEIGRAGRDGKISRCELLLFPGDRITLENFVYGDTPSAPSIKILVEEIHKQPEAFFISLYSLSGVCDIKSIVIKTLLTYLELDGYIESTSPRYDSYSFKPIVPSATILEHFSGERQEFAKRLLSCSKKSKVWFSIDISDAMGKLGCDRQRVVKALDYFSEQGWLELKVSGLVHGYRKLKPFDSIDAVVDTYATRIQQREDSEVARIEQVFELARGNRCQAALLSEHFGQPLESDCGHCSFCLGEGRLEIKPPATPTIPAEAFETIRQLVLEHPKGLSSKRSVARLLCGMTSPALTKSKLSKHELFGSCADISFAHVIQQVGKLYLSDEIFSA